MARARALSDAHLDGAAEPEAVRWVDNQHRRWGSCTPADRTIRLSSRLRSMPEYVVDYILYHELLHKKHGAVRRDDRRCVHTPEFRAEERLFPRYAEADAFLERLAKERRREAREAASA